MTKGKKNHDEPPMANILKAIDQERGRYNDCQSQTGFVRGLLVPKYTNDLEEQEITDKASKLRRKLAKMVKSKYMGWWSGEGRGRKMNFYDIHHLFQLGPQKVLPRKYLDWHAFDHPETSDEESEASDGEDEDEDEDWDDEYQPKGHCQAPETAKSSKKRTLGRPLANIDVKARQSASTSKVAASHSPQGEIRLATSNSVSATHVASGNHQQKPGENPPSDRQGSTSNRPGGQKRKATEQGGESDSSEYRPGEVKRQKTTHTNPYPESETRSSVRDIQQAEEWSKIAGLQKTPAILPTKPPARPSEITPMSDKVWLSQHMDCLSRALWNATLSYFQEYGIANGTQSEFVINPLPELRELYEAFVGDTRWQAWSIDQKSPQALRQDYTVMGLFGASIWKYAIGAKLPWDVSVDIPKRLETDAEYLEAVINDLGHDMKTVLQYVAGKQIADTKFQNSKVANFAQAQAGSVAQILRRHLQTLSKSPGPVDGSSHEKWIVLLEKAFQEAIIIKQTLRASPLGPFRIHWPQAGTPLATNKHHLLFPLPGANEVLHTVLPSIWRKLRDRDDVVFSKALVIPAISSKGKQG